MQTLVLKNKGLFTSSNEFSAVPEGAMVVADDCSIDKDGVVEPRRGFARQVAFSSSGDRARRYTFYNGTQIAAYSNGKIAKLSGGTWSDYSGTYNDPDSSYARLQFLQVLANLYFNTSNGVYRLDSTSGTPVLAGIPKGLDIQLTVGSNGTAVETANMVAYRQVWCFKDANNTLFIGSPSGRSTYSNASGSTKDVTVRFTIPSGITTSYFFQVYRSTPSGGATTEPNDDLQLIYENYPTSTDITNGYVEFTDSVPASLLGASLYTNPNQEGILQANDRPPKADYIATYANCTFFAKCVGKQRKILTLLSASALTVNDTLTIAGVTYTVKSAESIAAGEFKKFTTGTPAQNIADTVDSLIRVINRYSSNTTVYATLLSSYQDLPGKILLEERSTGGSSFAITASAAGTAYNPVLPTSGTTVSSENDNFQHQLFYSKKDKPEAVPLLNYQFVGSLNNQILGIIPLTNSLYIFKENEGIYRLTGTDPSNFQIELFDSSAKLLAPDSLAVVNNQIWCLTDQGITAITDTGVNVISRPIEDDILTQTGLALTALKTYSFGVGYETDRKYILWTVSGSSDTYATQAFVFNTFTRAFTRWVINATTALVPPDDNKLYIGSGDTQYTLQERKSLDYTDFVDKEISVTISSVSGTTIVLNTGDGAEAEVGDVLVQSGLFSVVTAVSTDTLTVTSSLSFTAGAASLYKSFESVVQYVAITGGNPGSMKQFSDAHFHFKSARFGSIEVGFATDNSSAFEYIDLAGQSSGGFGLFIWGSEPWGGTSVAQTLRTLVPLEKQWASLMRVEIRIKQGYSNWKLNGVSLWFTDFQTPFVAK